MALRLGLTIGLIWISAAVAQSAEKELKKAGIEATADGVLAYLRVNALTPENRGRVTRLMKQLGSDKFRERQEAQKALSQIPLLSYPPLADASRGDDPEVRMRALKVLSAKAHIPAHQTLRAALKFLAAKKPGKGAELVLQAIPLCQDEAAFLSARVALSGCVSPSDQDLLVRSLKSPVAKVRLAAVSCVERKRVKALKVCLRDKSDKVRLRAAMKVLNAGDRDGLATLVELLRSEAEVVRNYALAVLNHITGRRESSTPDDEAAAVWKAWLAWDSDAAKLRLPFNSHVDRDLVGSRWLITLNRPGDTTRQYTIALKADGKLATSAPGWTTDHRWVTRSSFITFTLNGGFATYTGVIPSSEFMSGHARNKNGKSWIWEARRVRN